MTTPVPAATPLKLDVIRFGTQQCIALNDYRIAGGKPWGGGNIEATFQVDPADLWSAAHKALSAFAAPAPAEPCDGEAFPALGDAPMIARALRELDWSNASIGHKAIVTAAAVALETLSVSRSVRPDAGEAVAADVVAGDIEYLNWLSECGSLSLKKRGKARQIAERLTRNCAHPPAASAETARVAELSELLRDIYTSHELGIILIGKKYHDRIKAALGAQEVQS